MPITINTYIYAAAGVRLTPSGTRHFAILDGTGALGVSAIPPPVGVFKVSVVELSEKKKQRIAINEYSRLVVRFF